MKLASKVAIVTGGSSGIGRAIGQRFQKEGARVMFVGRREKRLAEAAGTDGAFVVADLLKPADCTRVADKTIERFGAIHILINAAGVIGNDSILGGPDKEWRRVMDSNIETVYNMSRAAGSHIAKHRGGSILNLSSVTSVRPYANLLSYCASKAAVDMMTKCMALEFAPHGVRVNAINPGVVVTELHTVTNVVPDYPAFLEKSKTTHPLGRVGSVEDISSLALFLASEESSWITGGLHHIDGGRQLMSAR